MTGDSFFDQPYSNRQLVIFLDDAVIAASKKASIAKTSTSYREFAAVAVTTLAGGITGDPALIRTARALAEIIVSYWEARDQGVENLKLVAKSKISLFQLPPGHPRDGVVYAGHPGIPNIYVPLADFHRLTFEHKFAEVVSLLMHLGAKTFKVEHITGWGAEFSSHLSIGLPATVPEIEVGAESSFKHQTQQTVLFHATLDNQQAPSLPTNLVWYPYEATWQQVAEGRLKFGLKDFLLYLNYNDDFGINAGLKLKIEKAGFDLGGTFERLTATTWRISGRF